MSPLCGSCSAGQSCRPFSHPLPLATQDGSSTSPSTVAPKFTMLVHCMGKETCRVLSDGGWRCRTRVSIDSIEDGCELKYESVTAAERTPRGSSINTRVHS